MGRVRWWRRDGSAWGVRRVGEGEVDGGESEGVSGWVGGVGYWLGQAKSEGVYFLGRIRYP